MPIDSALTKYGAFSPGVCTSTTRPTSPYQGQSIYESDTGSFLVYYGATTGWKPPWNQPWGVITNISSLSNTITAGNVAGLSYTLNAVANRLYQITITVKTSWSATGRLILTLSDGGATVQRIADYSTAVSSDQAAITGVVSRSFTAGAHSLAVAFSVISGTVVLGTTASNTHELTITDIGPSTSTAPTS